MKQRECITALGGCMDAPVGSPVRWLVLKLVNNREP